MSSVIRLLITYPSMLRVTVPLPRTTIGSGPALTEVRTLFRWLGRDTGLHEHGLIKRFDAATGWHPVVCVNLGDALAYADWLSVRTGHHYRLPSNTEWEYAARAGPAMAQWWEPTGNPCKFANLANPSFAESFHIADTEPLLACVDGYPATAPVGSFPANHWGLHDMLGNVWEWTLDCLNDTQIEAPADTSARISGDCGSHIDRGASRGNSRKSVRAAAQHPDLIGARTAVLGFRLVEDLR